MWRHIRTGAGLAIIYCLERGAGMMWPEVSAWTWWSTAIALSVFLVIGTYWREIASLGGRIPQRPRMQEFDVRIRDAIRHIIHTTPHSYQTAQRAADHYFEVLYEKMCSGRIRVVGRKGEDGELQPISKRECKRFMPLSVVIPRNPSAPEGWRYSLVDRDRPPTRSPLQDAVYVEFTDLRVQSRDLYKWWPKTKGRDDNA